MSRLAILVADDHDIVRRGLRAVLGARPGWEVVAEVTDGAQAVDAARRSPPDVAVLDLSMPGLNGLDAARQIRQFSPRTRIIILTVHRPSTLVKEVVAAGASGLVLKSDASEQLISAIEMVAGGQMFFSGQLTGDLAGAIAGEASGPAELTPREASVVRMVANGQTNKEIAHAMGISIRTVETHRQNIMKKLHIASSSELVRWAVRHDLVDS